MPILRFLIIKIAEVGDESEKSISILNTFLKIYSVRSEFDERLDLFLIDEGFGSPLIRCVRSVEKGNFPRYSTHVRSIILVLECTSNSTANGG